MKWKTKYLSLQYLNWIWNELIFFSSLTNIETLLTFIQFAWRGNSSSSRFKDLFHFIYLSVMFCNNVQHQSITCNSHCMHVKEQNENWHLLVIWIFLFYYFVRFDIFAKSPFHRGDSFTDVILWCAHILLLLNIIFIHLNFAWDNVIFDVSISILCSSFELFDKLKSIKIINFCFKTSPTSSHHSKFAIDVLSCKFYYHTNVRIHRAVKTRLFEYHTNVLIVRFVIKRAPNRNSLFKPILWKFLQSN